ncbi:MAG: DUF2157 domain-containing protein [Bryobacteraceae bacterium]
MPGDWEKHLERWTAVGLLDGATVARIRAHELRQAPARRLNWPALIALSLGALLLGAGVLLFVSAHWDFLSPARRLALVLSLVAAFHLGGALTTRQLPRLASAFHAVGTFALGAGIFLANQTFHVVEQWPGGLMLWAAGGWIGFWLLRDWPQLAFAAVLTPTWLAGEWLLLSDHMRRSIDPVIGVGLFLTSLTYLAALLPKRSTPLRMALAAVGGITLIPAALLLVLGATQVGAPEEMLPVGWRIAGWAVALAAPFLAACALRGREAWPNFAATVWVAFLILLAGTGVSLFVYFWCLVTATGIAFWGVKEGRAERINLGIAGFALTVLFFYFSNIMDRLERSASLIGLGLLFLAGGWALERMRRGLIAQLRQEHR